MKAWIWITIILVVVLGAGAVFWFLIWPKYQISITPVSTPTISTSTSAQVKNKITDKGVTWIEPQKMDDLGLILTTQSDPKSESVIYDVEAYYKVADLAGGGELIVAKTSFDGPGLPMVLRFKKDADGIYYYLVKLSDEKEAVRYDKFLAKTVVADTTTSYMSLANPDFLVFKETTLKASGGGGFFADYTEPKPTLLGETEYGKLYQSRVSSADNGVGGANFSLVLADATYATYTIKFPFLTDDGIAQITWDNGTKNTEKFTAEGYVSCGIMASDNMIFNEAKIDSRLTEAGMTDEGDKIYKAGAEDVIVQKAYENYTIGRETADTITIEQFAAKDTVFVWRAPLGSYIVFTNRNYGGLAECGKPVIYLYPQKAMNVSVKVQADITKSEPVYNNGWTALADPSGKLVVNGKTYDSLFWEGQGLDYPAINAGTVVKSGEAIVTIKSQLAQMRFTEKEIADFVEFWAPKMPTTPYTRLTWFGTKEMNKLAPLTINPAPDTLIRVFLDFEGLNAPVSIAPQKLNPFTRRGFTVVEWGGLLK